MNGWILNNHFLKPFFNSLQNFIKNNLCKVSRRRARDRDRNPSRPRQDLRDRDSKKRVSRRVSGPRPSLETPSLIHTSSYLQNFETLIYSRLRFPANLGLFFCGFTYFSRLAVACFWVVLIKICSFFGLVFADVCFLDCFFQILWFFCCFNLLQNEICACFCVNCTFLACFFRICFPAFIFLFTCLFDVFLSFLPIATLACFFSVKFPILSLFLKFASLFLQNKVASLWD